MREVLGTPLFAEYFAREVLGPPLFAEYFAPPETKLEGSTNPEWQTAILIGYTYLPHKMSIRIGYTLWLYLLALRIGYTDW